jgi:hypothetical protein
VLRLLEKLDREGGRSVVFAERRRRSESLLFRMGYAAYRLMHYALTGRRVRFGNFSAIPARRLDSLVVMAEMWNHYAAAVVKSRLPYCTIPTQRASRLHGASSMRAVDLVVHGLSAISVHGDVVGVRLLFGVMLLIALVLMTSATAVAVRFLTPLAIPGWATTVVGISLVLLVQALLLAAFLSVLILGGRQSTSFVPLRDYTYFIAGTRRLYPRA